MRDAATLNERAGTAVCAAIRLPVEVPARAEPALRTTLCVLSSSSSGNCSALIHGEGKTRRVTLIDCGLSPRRTRTMLSTLGLTLEHIDDVILTHLDHDHFNPSWINALPRHARFRVHKRHTGRAERAGVLHRRSAIFEDAFVLPSGGRVTPVLLSHDDLGVAAFRFDFDAIESSLTTQRCDGGSLGYATDLGRVTDELVRTLTGVDVLAIESNYCPTMQLASNRPEFLKRRIMDGCGHLSNEECRDATRAIAPRREVVLLHLSRQCNTPEKAASMHIGASYRLTVASHDMPTSEITVT